MILFVKQKHETHYNIINRYKTYKFDNIVTRISMIIVLQHVNDHNLIYSTDRIYFACLNHSHLNKMPQQDNQKHHIIISR